MGPIIQKVLGFGWCTSLNVGMQQSCKTNFFAWALANKQLSPKTLKRDVQETKIFATQLYLPYCSSTVKENFQQKVSRIVLLCQAHCYSSSSSEILYNFSILLMTVPSTSSKSLASELPNSIFVTQGREKSNFVSIPRNLTLSKFAGYWKTF